MKKFVYISLILIGITAIQQVRVSVPDAIVVFAGIDRTMCLTQNLLMTDLNATITGDVNNGDWLTYGDGRFQPGNLLTVRYNVAQTNQITYVPGPNDKALGYYRLLLMSDAPVNNPQERVTDEVRINFQTAPPLFCSNNINISLNESCRQKVDASMLQPNPVQPYSNYIITLYDPAGNIIPDNILTKDHIDKEITFKLGHQCTTNICWGKFKVEDYFPPVFVCKNDTIPCTKSFSPDSLGFPFPSAAYIDTLIDKKYIVKNWDACSDVTLEFTDVVTKAHCARGEDKTIARKWKASDAKGNTSYCTELIVVKSIALSQVIFPPNFEGHEKPAFECGDTFPTLLNGHPSPDTTGAPITGHCIDLQANYSDVPFALCGRSFKIARSWFVIDWCTAESITKNQIIAVKDSKGPEVTCNDSLFLEAGAYQCATSKITVPSLISISDCSDYQVTYELYDKLENNVSHFLMVNQQNTFIEGLPVGMYTLLYIVTDACQNKSVCESQLIVEDNSPPYPACDGLTKVALDANGKGRIFANTFDDGSTDNCGIAFFKARKMTDKCGFGLQNGDYIDFCCAELGQTIMVALEVTDIHGHKNTCMVEVIVEDKLKPTITCPPNITIACTDNYDFAHLDIFGKVVTNPSDRKDVIVNNLFHNGVVGKDGLAKDNCNVTVTSSYREAIECHTGFIYRTFVAADANGLKDSCIQTITILNPDPFDESNIRWPQNYTSNGCKLSQTLPDLTGRPTFTNTQCGNIAATYEDTPFFAADSACLKIFRVWTVIDWCQFNQSSSFGKFGPYTQIIKLHNTDKPAFTSLCSETTFCSYDNLCQTGNVSLVASAEDPCTEAENLVWSYEVDLDKDGTVDIIGNSRNFTRDVHLGTHSITWTVADPCGNKERCTRSFKVEDCKKPTPYCISSLTLSLDEVKGSVEIWARDFDNGSFDNCTDTSKLYFTFDGALPVKAMINLEHFFTGNGIPSNRQVYESGQAQKWIPDSRSSGTYLDCDDIANGISDTINLEMSVTDLNGNQDFCMVNVILQDNHDHCMDIITNVNISGTIKTETSKVPVGISVEYATTEINDSTKTKDNDGSYVIENMPVNKNYKITPTLNSSVIEGITTLDLVLIQRHILGIKALDSPFKLIAADVNASKAITAADLVDIRKVILGISEKFPKNVPSWVFVAKDGGIIDPVSPFNYVNHIETGLLTHDYQNADFVAVKMGDVNDSALGLQNDDTESRNTKPNYRILASEEIIKDQHYLVFRASEDINMDGLQIFMQADPNSFIDERQDNFTPENMESEMFLNENGLNFLLYGSKPAYIRKGEIIYALKYNGTQDITDLSLQQNTFSELYENSKAKTLLLDFNKDPDDLPAVTLITNPVADDLRLHIPNVDKDATLSYTITNTEGRVFSTSTLNLQPYVSEYDIKLSEMPPGLYFLNMHSGTHVQTLKFILIR